ncbi:MAG TPA: hypothetical protein VK905_02200 [Bacillota bacterium]|nr:hypothetical protein [Bacillota bacterium]
MPVTIEYMRYLLLTATHAFDGKRGRSGVLSYLRGEATPNTMELGSDSGIKHLYGVLRGVDAAEIQEVLNSLLTSKQLEIKKLASGDKEIPLLYLTDFGQRELLRLAALGFESVSSEGLTVDRLLQSLIIIADLIDHLNSQGGEPEAELRQYMELFGKAMGVNAEVYLATPPGRKQFASLLQRHLHSGLFGYLPELEAQCLRLRSGFSPPHQLDLSVMSSLFGTVDVESVARRAGARMVDKSWEHRNSIHSVLSFFTIARRQ